jgi:hypothetical protein
MAFGDGIRIRPPTAAAAGAEFAIGLKMSYQRFTLPRLVKGHAANGMLYAILCAEERGQPIRTETRSVKQRLRYSLSVHAHSNLRGGNAAPQTTPHDEGRAAEALCMFANCLVSGALEPALRKAAIDPQSVLKCIAAACERSLGPPSKDELARREGTA